MVVVLAMYLIAACARSMGARGLFVQKNAVNKHFYQRVPFKIFCVDSLMRLQRRSSATPASEILANS